MLLSSVLQGSEGHPEGQQARQGLEGTGGHLSYALGVLGDGVAQIVIRVARQAVVLR